MYVDPHPHTRCMWMWMRRRRPVCASGACAVVFHLMPKVGPHPHMVLYADLPNVDTVLCNYTYVRPKSHLRVLSVPCTTDIVDKLVHDTQIQIFLATRHVRAILEDAHSSLQSRNLCLLAEFKIAACLDTCTQNMHA